MAKVNLRSVSSSNIQGIGYDPETRTLEVQFHGGKHWRYFDVAPHAYQALMSADSVGKHFGTHIRSLHSGEEVKAK